VINQEPFSPEQGRDIQNKKFGCGLNEKQALEALPDKVKYQVSEPAVFLGSAGKIKNTRFRGVGYFFYLLYLILLADK